MAVTCVWSDIWRCRYITPHAVMYGSSRFLTLCAVSTKRELVFVKPVTWEVQQILQWWYLGWSYQCKRVYWHKFASSRLYLRNSSFDCMLTAQSVQWLPCNKKHRPCCGTQSLNPLFVWSMNSNMSMVCDHRIWRELGCGTSTVG